MPVHFWFFRVWVVYTFSLPVSLPVSLYFLHHVCLIQVTIALRFHLFPFRTEKLSSVTPMVLRNSGRVGSRRFLESEAPVSEDAGAFLFSGLFCLPCLILALFCLLCFSLFCLLSWGQQIFSADYFILVKCFSFFAFRVLYRIIPISHHISGKHLLLCLSVLMSKKMLCLLCGEKFYLCLFKQVLKSPFPFPYRMSIP